MKIDNIGIKRLDSGLVCKATVITNNWSRINNIWYRCHSAKWLGDYDISDNVKKLCRAEWNKVAKKAGISRKELNISI